MDCAPTGCQCPCHQPMTGMSYAHLVACCNPDAQEQDFYPIEKIWG